MSSNKEDFLNTFHTQLQTFLLPHKLETSYQIVNCLKDTDDKAVFQLKNSKGQLFVLKRGLRGQIPLLEQEYHILSQLESNNESLFPRCTDFWMEDDVCYLLRTYIQGSSLADYLDNKSSLSQNELLTITFTNTAQSAAADYSSRYNPGLFEGTPNIVSYATCPEEEQSAYYEQALIDYIATLNNAFDGYYGYETPTEKGYSKDR